MTPTEVAFAFVDAINKKDLERLAGLMTGSHKFIDGDGSEHVGKDQMKAGWRVVIEAEKVAVWQLFANQCALHEIYDRIHADRS